MKDELESLQRKHEPSIAEFGMKKAKLKQKVAQLQSDFDSLDLDSMLVSTGMAFDLLSVFNFLSSELTGKEKE